MRGPRRARGLPRGFPDWPGLKRWAAGGTLPPLPGRLERRDAVSSASRMECWRVRRASSGSSSESNISWSESGRLVSAINRL